VAAGEQQTKIVQAGVGFHDAEGNDSSIVERSKVVDR